MDDKDKRCGNCKYFVAGDPSHFGVKASDCQANGWGGDICEAWDELPQVVPDNESSDLVRISVYEEVGRLAKDIGERCADLSAKAIALGILLYCEEKIAELQSKKGTP